MVEFKAERVGSEIVVKAIIETDASGVKVHVPSFPIIQELKRTFKEREVKDGIRDIQ